MTHDGFLQPGEDVRENLGQMSYGDDLNLGQLRARRGESMRKRDEVAAGAAALSDRVVALALPATSPPQMVAVSGDPGSGRTTLLREVVARLQRDAVWVDCSVFAHRTPWRSMHEAVSSTSHAGVPGRDGRGAGGPPGRATETRTRSER